MVDYANMIPTETSSNNYSFEFKIYLYLKAHTTLCHLAAN